MHNSSIFSPQINAASRRNTLNSTQAQRKASNVSQNEANSSSDKIANAISMLNQCKFGKVNQINLKPEQRKVLERAMLEAKKIFREKNLDKEIPEAISSNKNSVYIVLYKNKNTKQILIEFLTEAQKKQEEQRAQILERTDTTASIENIQQPSQRAARTDTAASISFCMEASPSPYRETSISALNLQVVQTPSPSPQAQTSPSPQAQTSSSPQVSFQHLRVQSETVSDSRSVLNSTAPDQPGSPREPVDIGSPRDPIYGSEPPTARCPVFNQVFDQFRPDIEIITTIQEEDHQRKMIREELQAFIEIHEKYTAALEQSHKEAQKEIASHQDAENSQTELQQTIERLEKANLDAQQKLETTLEEARQEAANSKAALDKSKKEKDDLEKALTNLQQIKNKLEYTISNLTQQNTNKESELAEKIKILEDRLKKSSLDLQSYVSSNKKGAQGISVEQKTITENPSHSPSSNTSNKFLLTATGLVVFGCAMVFVYNYINMLEAEKKQNESTELFI